jgi:hypothetical protein
VVVYLQADEITFKKILMSQFGMALAGVGFICGIFGIWALWRTKKALHSV